jgi:hypothetical protein
MEEIQELKKINRSKEDQLETRIINFERDKQHLHQKCKEEAMTTEKKKRDKFQQKVERIKRQEIAEIKREADRRL